MPSYIRKLFGGRKGRKQRTQATCDKEPAPSQSSTLTQSEEQKRKLAAEAAEMRISKFETRGGVSKEKVDELKKSGQGKSSTPSKSSPILRP